MRRALTPVDHSVRFVSKSCKLAFEKIAVAVIRRLPLRFGSINTGLPGSLVSFSPPLRTYDKASPEDKTVDVHKCSELDHHLTHFDNPTNSYRT
jgi:hypothetical protein